jgi:tRNA 2-thiouridine synthesizing protein D
MLGCFFMCWKQTNLTTFCIIITSPSLDEEGAYSAYRFAQAAIASGHKITGVFFYQSGVTLANNFQSVLSDERNLHVLWREFALQHKLPLQVCVTAANRRGLLSQTESQEESSTTGFNISPPFESVGIGELMVQLDNSDRSIQF